MFNVSSNVVLKKWCAAVRSGVHWRTVVYRGEQLCAIVQSGAQWRTEMYSVVKDAP